jgi:hypothetical protein
VDWLLSDPFDADLLAHYLYFDHLDDERTVLGEAEAHGDRLLLVARKLFDARNDYGELTTGEVFELWRAPAASSGQEILEEESYLFTTYDTLSEAAQALLAA